MVDRSTTEIVVSGEEVMAEPAPAEIPRRGVQLTPAAASIRDDDHKLRWLEERLRDLKLPPEEFLIEIGVKGKRSGWGVAVRPDSLALWGGETTTALTRVRVEVTDYLIRFTWRHAAGELTIPVSFPKSVLEMNRREAALVSKIRWVMTELMLGRFGLQGYR